MKPLVIANWKMNPAGWREAKKLLEGTRKLAIKAKGISLIVAPPALYFRELSKSVRGSKLSFAVQDAHFDAGGAHTGEISLKQAKDAGAAYAIIGHSEVRARGETNETTGKKVAAALALKLVPILCVGEKERTQTGSHFSIIAEQLKSGFGNIPAASLPRVLIAYEPVWAIGGEQAIRPTDMHEMAIFIRKTIVDMYGASGYKVKILYGGSANEENAQSMFREGDVDGLLVGHVSVDLERFSALLRSIN